MTGPRGSRGDGDWLGHPKGLTVLATAQMFERFAFYGMQGLLMLYMTKYLLLPEHARNVLGLTQYRGALSAVFGPLTDLAFAAQTFGIYSGLIYVTPLAGAWLGDRVIGTTRTVTIGCVLMSAGHLLMASEHFFLAALALLVLGGGCVIGTMAAQVGQLYDKDDDRRTRAFGVYLITLNLGALAAPLVIGTLGEKVAWRWGFCAAGIGMLLGLVTYLAGRRHLPPDRISRRGEHPRLTRAELRRVFAILFLLVPYMLYGAAAQQAYGIMYVWADGAVDRVILGWQVPVTWIGIFDGVMTIVGVMIANRIWIRLGQRQREPGEFTKMMIGYAGVGTAFVLAATSALWPVVPLLAWLAFFVVLGLSYGWVEPPIQSLVSRDSPASVNATMMAVLKLATALCYFLLGWLGRFYEPLGPPRYWLLTGMLSFAALGIVFLTRGPLIRELEPRD
jgi:proton-dependent oligopeptide transporter, POT family